MSHEDLHKRGVEIVEACEGALEELSMGIVNADATEIFRIVTDLAKRT